MKKILHRIVIILFTVGISSTLNAQNALSFDNVNDYATAPNGSSYIAGSTAISLSMWVYPNKAQAPSSDYDGFAGIRNNSNADFYMLQLDSNVEARFRNSAGVVAEVVAPGLVANTWQHFVLTYDGTTLTFYINGVSAGTSPATGTILNTSVPFEIGGLTFNATKFYMDGKLDEISLWNKCLSPTEIACIYNGAINPSDAGLQLYYTCNQGIANGTNTTVTTLNDATNHANATLTNFNLSGTFSNWVNGISTPNSSTTSAALCQGTNYVFDGQVISTPGTYYKVYPTISGCDSVSELVLTSQSINLSLLQGGSTLYTQQPGATFAWADCNNNYAVLSGYTGANFTAPANGSYAAIITLLGCSDTTICKTITTIGIPEFNYQGLFASPNPFSEQLNLTVENFTQEFNFHVFNVLGEMMLHERVTGNGKISIPTANWPKGFYMLVPEGGSIGLKLIHD